MTVTIIKEILKARPRTFVLMAVLLLLNIGLLAYVGLYQKPRLAEIQGNWFEKRRSAAGSPSGDMAAVYLQGEKDLQAWQARIIPKKDFARFVGGLFETARNNALTYKGLSFKASQVKGENLAAYAIDMNVEGKYGAVKKFIADLARKREIMTIDNLALTSKVETGEAVALKIQLTVYLRTETL